MDNAKDRQMAERFTANDARNDLRAAAATLDALVEPFAGPVASLAARMSDVFRIGGRVLACGNGGSASDAEHVIAELTGRFYFDRPPLDAIALTANSSLTTAVANDYGYGEVFARQVAAHGRTGDVLLLFTTSGQSENVLRAAKVGVERGLYTVAFTGSRGAEFGGSCDLAFVVPATESARIQEAHITLAHVLCRAVEAHLFGEGA
jgi:D-sedoheptulose 7-phosphate isomerase